MDSDWLSTRLEEGRSIESIAREVGRDPSTVAYWVNRHGLVSAHAARHAARGGLERAGLEALVHEGRSVREIAASLGRSPTTVRHWLRRYGLQTQPSRYARRDAPKPAAIIRECASHGWTTFRPVGADRQYRCARCLVTSVTERRRALKRTLVQEAGGRCARCGYDRYPGALQFHHRDVAAKAFSVSNGGVARSLEALREEARKCLLLCANCHAEVEAGLWSADNPYYERRAPSGVAQHGPG
jgi:transposase